MTKSITHRVLVVGVGSIGERHLRCFQATNRALMSICDIDGSLVRRIGDQYGIAQRHTDLRHALRDAPDAVVIATPAHLHIDMAIAAAESGCHLLIEKPLSTSLANCRLVGRLVQEQRLTAMVAYVMRSHPSLAAMKNALDEGRFGSPLHLYATCGQHFPRYRPAYRDIYYRSRATGGGAIQDALTHVLNAAQWLVGPIDRLAADASHQKLAGVEVEDTVNVIARHGRVMASYALNQHQAPNEMTITIACDNGTARFEYHNATWRWMSEPDAEWQEECLEDFQRDSIFLRQADSFLNAIENRQVTPCTLDEGIATLKANLAVLKALDGQTWIRLDN